MRVIEPAERRPEWAILAFALVYPAVLTLVYFVWLTGFPELAQQTAYGVGKAIQFLLPVVWIGLICREPLHWPRTTTRGLAAGIGFALVVVAGMAALYFGWFRASGEFAESGTKMAERLRGIGVASPAAYAVVALFYSLAHSLFEEYYWRWFVFRRLRRAMMLWPAVAISSVGFMAHHVIVLGTYFGWNSPWTYFFSLATAVGGAYWAWLYNRSGSIYGPWASHLLIDAGIFGIGYDLMLSASQSTPLPL